MARTGNDTLDSKSSHYKSSTWETALAFNREMLISAMLFLKVIATVKTASLALEKKAVGRC